MKRSDDATLRHSLGLGLKEERKLGYKLRPVEAAVKVVSARYARRVTIPRRSGTRSVSGTAADSGSWPTSAFVNSWPSVQLRPPL
jgi:hypothetical protein